MGRLGLALSVAVLASAAQARADEPARPAAYQVRSLPLPGGGPDGIAMDYLAFDGRTGELWVPAGNTGAVDVVDTRSGAVRQVSGFRTRAVERAGRKRTVGPSAASVGDGVVYVGSRGDFSVCAVDERTLRKGACVELDAMPDGVAYVAPTREVWVTTPGDRSLRILDAATLAEKGRVRLAGEPEGTAVDARRRRFYTNLEDQDRTLAIDLATRATVASWSPSCGAAGPRGLALDEEAGLLFVACTTRAVVLDAARDGAVRGRIETGAGLDNLDYAPATHLLYAGAAIAARLTIARVEAGGGLTPVGQVATKEGARNGVVTDRGAVYLACSPSSELLVASPVSRH